MNNLKEFLKDKPTYIKIIILICVGVIIFFSSGCSLKADKLYFENPDFAIGKRSNALWISEMQH